MIGAHLPWIAPVIFTEKYDSVAQLFCRLVTRLSKNEFHILTQTEDLFDPIGRAHKSTMGVRALHKRVFEKVKEKHPNLLTWINQFGMVMVQWAATGLIFAYPRQCGLHGNDKHVMEVLSHINYVWRGIGYKAGVKDEFNLCSGSVEETIVLSHIILREVMIPTVTDGAKGNPIGHELSVGLLEAFRAIISIGLDPKLYFLKRVFTQVVPGATVFYAYWMKICEVEESLKSPLSMREKLQLYGLKRILQFFMKAGVVTWAIDRYLNHCLSKCTQPKKKELVVKKLQKLYPERTFTMEAYLKSVDVKIQECLLASVSEDVEE